MHIKLKAFFYGELENTTDVEITVNIKEYNDWRSSGLFANLKTSLRLCPPCRINNNGQLWIIHMPAF